MQLGDVYHDDRMFAPSSRTDAAVFWRWLATVLPKSQVVHLVPPITASKEIMDFYHFELTLIMLIGELLKICNNVERATSVS